jgi:general secretion pathway protein E
MPTQPILDVAQQARQLGLEYLSGEQLAAAPLDFAIFPLPQARLRRALPVRFGDRAAVVVSDATNDSLMEWATLRAGPKGMVALADPGAVLERLAAELPGSVQADAGNTSLSDSGVVGFVDSVVRDAWETGASDIHFETRRSGLTVKLRRDGVLVPAQHWNGAEPPSEVLSRIKVLADLDISENRVPQDGRFTRQLGGRDVDFRVSVMPNPVGEDAVLRILDKRHLMGDRTSMTLASLGFAGETARRIRSLARRPHGMLLVTGPTGSGKTTTLYACISETLTGREKVITIEDPIEYDLPGVLQIPVNEKKGLTFARGLRSILRHDPDTIFVGEIRDPETADIAVQSALTGHLVFTTVHANNVFDVIGRFLHMRVDMFSFMSALNGVVSQRLVRLLCERCAVRDEAARFPRVPGPLFKPVGCDACRGTGYAGRTVVSEALVVDDKLRELVVARAAVGALRTHAKELVGACLEDDAVALASQGRTSVEELARVLAIE